MGLGRMLNRSIEYKVTNTDTGHTELFTVNGSPPLSPDWSTDDYRGGMTVPGCWRAATLISDMLGSVPWDAYRKIGNRPAQQLLPVPALLEQPSPPETRMTTFSSMALDLIWEGNAIGLVASRDASGYPTSIFPVPASDVQIRRVTPSAFSMLPVGEIEYMVGPIQNLSSYDVIHVKGPCKPGSLRGMGVLEAHLYGTLKLAKEQMRQANGLAGNGVPTGKLTTLNPDTTTEELAASKEAWINAQRTRTVAALGYGTDFVPIGWNAEELQMVESRKFSLQEQALIMGIPPYWLGVEAGSMTYSNAEQQWLDLVKTTLGGHLARFEQKFSQYFPRGSWVKANLDAYLRSDTMTRYQAHATAITSGFLTVNEVREIEDREPLPESVQPESVQLGNDPQTTIEIEQLDARGELTE